MAFADDDDDDDDGDDNGDGNGDGDGDGGVGKWWRSQKQGTTLLKMVWWW